MKGTFSSVFAAGAAGMWLLSGCAGIPKHEVHVSEALRAHPVESVLIFEPGLRKKIKRVAPEDLQEMDTEHRAASSQQILQILKRVIGSSLMVESAFIPDESARAWARKITDELSVERVPLSVEPMELPVESVLLVGLLRYGQIRDQVRVRALQFIPGTKTYKLGKERWQYICDLQILLVNPREGTVLLEVRHDARLSSPLDDPQLLEQVATEAAWAVLNAFPVPAQDP